MNNKCCRCGGTPAESTWDCCANGNKKLHLCQGCDMLLNLLAMEFCNVKNKEEKLWKYMASKVYGQ